MYADLPHDQSVIRAQFAVQTAADGKDDDMPSVDLDARRDETSESEPERARSLYETQNSAST